MDKWAVLEKQEAEPQQELALARLSLVPWHKQLQNCSQEWALPIVEVIPSQQPLSQKLKGLFLENRAHYSSIVDFGNSGAVFSRLPRLGNVICSWKEASFLGWMLTLEFVMLGAAFIILQLNRVS